MNKRIFLSPPWMCGRERERVEEAFASNYIAPCGPMVDRFEREFASAVGLPHACALSSCTAALDLLFHELGVGRGDLVFCSDQTFVASIAPAVHRGAEPVFIDSHPATWTMDPGLLREALADARRAGRLPKAVVAVDLYGQCCDYDAIQAACEECGVPLLVDSAEAMGASYGGRHAGDAGWAAVYSFNGNKLITTSGGGMLASRDGGVVERARKRSQQSREPAAWYEHREIGYNYRMSNIVAAIGVGQLESLQRIVEKKRQIFDWYRERLGPLVGFMPEAAYGRCTRWLTVAELEVGGQKSEVGCRVSGGGNQPSTRGGPSETVGRLVQALEAENIESRPLWKPMHAQPVFRGARVYGGSVSERLFARGICLPSGAGLQAADVERVSALVARCLSRGAPEANCAAGGNVVK
jgi:dTDP-4-amino-4,6-dideoxygalactose transaminase